MLRGVPDSLDGLTGLVMAAQTTHGKTAAMLLTENWWSNFEGEFVLVYAVLQNK